jgi:pimeloyl-ACP methyl ester carboxylesterase
MGQEKLRQQWRMHAFDLPGHGRSPLPNGTANWNWRLTESNYTKWVLSYMDAAGIEKTTLMGCSMGTAISLALLAEHPDRFYGAVLLEAPYCSPGRRSIYLNHSQVHGARLSAAWVGSLLSPTSGKAHRDQATWIYSQGAPGIYDGDLGYYSDDFNANHHTGAIDTQRTPVWLFTGDYDYSATPADSAKVASEIKGAHFQELKGFGHFPMVERPDDLTLHLLPALAAIQAHIQS